MTFSHFFSGLGDEFHSAVARDKDEVDLLIMIGSSLKVRPVALIPSSIDMAVPQVKMQFRIFFLQFQQYNFIPISDFDQSGTLTPSHP